MWKKKKLRDKKKKDLKRKRSYVLWWKDLELLNVYIYENNIKLKDEGDDGSNWFVGCVVTNYELIFGPNKVGQTRFCVYLLLTSFAKEREGSNDVYSKMTHFVMDMH